MKIPIFNYIHKAIKALDYTYDHFNLFGSGVGGSIHFAYPIDGTGVSEQYFINSLANIPVLEYENITIDKNVNVTAFNPSLGITNTPFYLKVNGTLTVNGHLHMDNLGGEGTTNNNGFSSNYRAVDSFSNKTYPVYIVENALNYIEGQKLPYVLNKVVSNGYENVIDNSGVTYKLFQYTDEGSVSSSNPKGFLDTGCSFGNYYKLRSYGSTPTFFNGNAAFTGAGPSSYVSNSNYGVQSASAISSSGYCGNYHNLSYNVSSNAYRTVCGQGGGGLLALYYKNITNNGPQWVDIDEKSPSKGQSFYTNIHCNGGIINSPALPTYFRGGGMMVIAARNIVIGPNGSITCDGVDGAGRIALLNRASTDSYIYGNGSIQTIAEFKTWQISEYSSYVYPDSYNYSSEAIVGGGGICLGYKR